MPMDGNPNILVLGGTGEGYQLSSRLCSAGVNVVSSLAGRTSSPVQPDGVVRIGGFGGYDAMADYLRREGTAAVVDATHPFATKITRQTIQACAQSDVPYLRIERPAWQADPGDRWMEFCTLQATLEAMNVRRVFAAVGRREIAKLGQFSCIRFLARSVEPPSDLPDNVQWLRGRGPFSSEAERLLFEKHSVEAILCRASGGRGGYDKLIAARQLGLPVYMIARPHAPHCDQVKTVDAACRWLDQLLGLRTCV